MFEKLSVQELFPTPLWICDLTEAHHRRLNADLKARIEALIEPRPAIELGSTWQTDPILHQLPQFADFIAIVEGAMDPLVEPSNTGPADRWLLTAITRNGSRVTWLDVDTLLDEMLPIAARYRLGRP